MGAARRLRGGLLLAVLAHLQLSALACPMDGTASVAPGDGVGEMSHGGHHSGGATTEDPADGSGEPAPCAAMMACGAPAAPAVIGPVPAGTHVTTTAARPSATGSPRFGRALEPPPPRFTS